MYVIAEYTNGCANGYFDRNANGENDDRPYT